jgi:hypothetical protein
MLGFVLDVDAMQSHSVLYLLHPDIGKEYGQFFSLIAPKDNPGSDIYINYVAHALY